MSIQWLCLIVIVAAAVHRVLDLIREQKGAAVAARRHDAGPVPAAVVVAEHGPGVAPKADEDQTDAWGAGR